MLNINSFIQNHLDEDIVKIDCFVPRYTNQPNPVTNEVDPRTLIFVNSGSKLYISDQTPLFKKLKELSTNGKISRHDRNRATKFIKKRIFEVRNIEKTLQHVFNSLNIKPH